MKPKLYIALSIHLSGVPAAHRASNGCAQYTILCRTTSQKRLAYILDTSISHLREFGGVHVDYPHPDRIHVVPVDEIDTVYYHVEHTATGCLSRWFKYTRPDWLAKRNPL